MIKLVSTILILLGVSAAVSALGQMLTPEPLSYTDRTAIVISVFEAPPTLYSLNYPFVIKTVSSDNLEFVDSSQLEKHGIRLVSADSLRETAKDNVVYYSLFRKISFHDGVALVNLALVTEGRPCFASHMHSESSYTYEVRRTANGLVANLIPRPPMMSLDLKRLAPR